MQWRFAPAKGFRVSDEAHRVTTFELFFDLVFVFAFTQVTQYMAATHSAIGILQALTILGLLWWSWVSYAWLANQTHVDEGFVKLGMSIAMIAMFVVALVIPEAYVDLPGGLYGPMVLVVAYVVVRVAHLSLYYVAAAQDPPLRRQVLRTSTAMLVGSGFLIAGALVDGALQTWLWLVGLGLDVLLTYLTSAGGSWRVHSAAHWAERFGLVVILALGESIVAIGVGAAREPISVPIIVGATLAVLVSIALWWLYFDTTQLAAERELSQLRGGSRAGLAIDGYTYLHFALIAGIVLAALGVEDVIAHVDDTEPLGWFGAAALYGGVSCYVAGVAFFSLRATRHVKWLRFGAAVLLLAGIPVAALLPPLVALTLLVVASAALIVVESARYAAHRREIREAHGHVTTIDADESA
ncbi:low temperature requirement protein A [Agromyces aurantiacus]|uniref:Low temperature requirement protein A n=1 Tax=Agromyces aurantiacus TaxID=165814 RepID=A0ABV9RC90_9MICO|nr:low temperature requirement protein A [Agromyces aurantiacus]MBM7505154.1 low temperature requirement protein LtrA [Agromyces aurantiacus]